MSKTVVFLAPRYLIVTGTTTIFSFSELDQVGNRRAFTKVYIIGFLIVK